MTKKCNQCDNTIKGKSVKYSLSASLDYDENITWYFCSKSCANEHYKNEIHARIMLMP